MGYIQLRLQNSLSTVGSTSNSLLTIKMLKISLPSMLRIHLTDGYNNIVRRNP